jgi:cobalt-zinc-cadmium efflux system protein
MEPTINNYQINRKSFILVIFLTSLMMIAEFSAGILSGSLALISDAGHMLIDMGALALAFLALIFSQKPATSEKTYGFYRAEILTALLNGSLLIVIAGWIFYEAFQRLFNPVEIKGLIMLIVACIGLLINLIGAYILSKASRENLNIRAALWHVFSDAISSVGVIIGGLIIVFTKFFLIDSIIGFLIGIIILVGAWKLVSESVDILLEATPKDIQLEEVIETLKTIEGVRDLHDLHIWTITSGIRAFSAHVLISDSLVSRCGDISKDVKKIIREKYSISHITLEFECENCPEGIVCKINHFNGSVA